MILKLNGRYNWKSQPERLIYTGKRGSWHTFARVETPWHIWCKVLDHDLHMLEETIDESSQNSQSENQTVETSQSFGCGSDAQSYEEASQSQTGSEE